MRMMQHKVEQSKVELTRGKIIFMTLSDDESMTSTDTVEVDRSS